MAKELRQQRDWVDGFLFVGNHLALDFLNTKPILDGAPRELLPNATALARWLAAAGITTTPKNRALVRTWSHSARGEKFVRKLVAFRERLRAAVLRLEYGLAPENYLPGRDESAAQKLSATDSHHPTRRKAVVEPVLRGTYARRPMGADSCGHNRIALRPRILTHSQVRVRIVRRSLLRHQQERFAPLVQYESLR